MASNRRKWQVIKNVICSASETDTLIEFHRNVLNEVKNLCVGLPFVSMRFFTAFRMTEGRFVISSPQRWHLTSEKWQEKKCHSERSEESLQLAYISSRWDSSLRSEWQIANSSLVFPNYGIKQAKMTREKMSFWTKWRISAVGLPFVTMRFFTS